MPRAAGSSRQPSSPKGEVTQTIKSDHIPSRLRGQGDLPRRHMRDRQAPHAGKMSNRTSSGTFNSTFCPLSGENVELFAQSSLQFHILPAFRGKCRTLLLRPPSIPHFPRLVVHRPGRSLRVWTERPTRSAETPPGRTRTIRRRVPGSTTAGPCGRRPRSGELPGTRWWWSDLP